MGSFQRSEQIDVLRALAIGMVILHHLGRGFLKGFVPELLVEGWTGVDLFFLISGYLVTRSFSQWLSSDELSFRQRAYLAVQYCLRRFWRILPPAWIWAMIPLSMASVFNLSGAFGRPEEVLREVIAIVQFRYNYFTVSSELGHLNHFWSLAVEEHFYLFLPIFLLLVPRKTNRSYGLIAVAISCCALRIVARNQDHNFGSLLFLTHFRVDGLALGSILGLFSDQLLQWGKGLKIGYGKLLFMRLTLVTIIVLLWIGPAVLSRSEVACWGFIGFALLSAILVVVAIIEKPLLPRSIAMNLASFLGKRSYSLYLIHVPLLQFFGELRFRFFEIPFGVSSLTWASALIETGFYLMILLGVTELNYRWIELPLVKTGRKYFSPTIPRGVL